MKVRVKKGKIGFIYGKLRKGDIPGVNPEEFTLKAFEHPKKLDGDGEPLHVSAEDQFSKVWMEKIEKDSPEEEIEESEEIEVKKVSKKKTTKKKSA